MHDHHDHSEDSHSHAHSLKDLSIGLSVLSKYMMSGLLFVIWTLIYYFHFSPSRTACYHFEFRNSLCSLRDLMKFVDSNFSEVKAYIIFIFTFFYF